jgi:hypothetical protein
MSNRTANRAGSGRLVAVGAAVSVSLMVVACGGSATSTTTVTAPKRAIPVPVTPGQLKALAAAEKHPIYWAGPFNGTYELTTIADGRTYIRYLPAGVPIGNPSLHLTVGTYVRPAPPYNAVKAAATAKKANVKPLKNGELAVQYQSRPQSVYIVFPGALYEVEVYDPDPAKAEHLVTSGKIVPIS